MKRTLHVTAFLALAACPVAAQVSMSTAEELFPGAHADHNQSLPNFDIRHSDSLPLDGVHGVAYSWRGGEVGRERQAAARRLAERIPALAISWDPTLGTPRFVRSTATFLTAAAPVEASTVVEQFVADNRSIFEIDPVEVEQSRRSRDYSTRHNGVHHLTFQQQIEGVDLFGAELTANVMPDGRLINVSSTMLPRPAGGFETAPYSVRPLAAIHRAAESIGAAITVEPAATGLAPGGSPGESQVIEWSSTPDFRTDLPVTTELFYFPRTRREIVPAWLVQLPEIGIGNTYMVLVDANDGTILWRDNLLDFLGGTQDITLRVYPSDSPTPGSPGFATPGPLQPLAVPRSLLTVTPASVAAVSPDHWINDGGNETLGNNVEAHLDTNADNSPDLPRPTGVPFRVFDFALNLTQAPTAYQDATVTNLFYHCNLYHDRLYALGFDEASGNFQTNNFGNGGAGGDPVQADAQDGSGTNNANFSTPADGSDGRMQMFVWTGPTPDRDGDLDAEIIYHEYSHGLSNRLVGGLSGTQSRGMGEGWGDYFGISLLANSGDDIHGTYPFVGYSTKDWSGQAENYYFGIRRFPYSTDLNKNPLTYADTDPAQNAYPPGIPQSVVVGNNPSSVHNVGEVWCSMLLECRANLWTSLGFSANELLMQLVVDGMKLGPSGPNFIEERDGILQADLVNNAGANLSDLWAGFAKRGLGGNAASPGGTSTTGVVEDFTIPALVFFAYPGGIPDQLLPSQATAFSVDISALGGATLVPGSGLLFTSVNGGAFAATAMTEGSPGQYTATIPAQSCFDEVEFYVSVNTNSGVVTDPSAAPGDANLALVFGSTLELFGDDFEANLGWTVTDSGGLTAGSWERGIPVNLGRGDPPADSDGSGTCFLTENDPVDSNSDVDNGSTTITSPVFDISGGGQIRYDYWLNDIASGAIGIEDGLQVEVATDAGGTNWVQLRNYQNTQAAWRTDTIQVGVDVPASSTIRIRFTATEVTPGDVLEAGIDAVFVEMLECSGGSAAFCDGSDNSLASCPCAPGGADSGCDVAQGTGGVQLGLLSQETSPQNRATVQGTGFPAASAPAAVVIRANALDPASPVVFGDGLRCVGASVVRLGAAFAGGGTSVHTFGHGSGPGSGTFYYQIWFRNTPISFCDPVAAFNLSSGGTLDW